jgi:hypothetical protein
MKEAFEFPMVTASKMSLTQRKLVYGVGVNDSEYKTYTRVEGKLKFCPYYSKWRSMIRRGYSTNYKQKHPTYKDVTVCKEWHTFSTFRSWMEKQDWKDKELDKDIINPDNKVYSPETCAFVSKRVNQLLTDNGKSRGKCKQGVCFYKNSGNFLAHCRDSVGKKRHLGSFPTEAQAYEAYVHYKHALILQVASEQEDERVKNGLLLHANILLESLNEENETLL